MDFLKWLYPGIRLKRWFFLFSLGTILVSVGMSLLLNYQYVGYLEEWLFKTVYLATGSYYYTITFLAGLSVLSLGLGSMLFATRQIIRSVIGALIPDGSEKFIDRIFAQRRLKRGPNIVVIGGGTGLSVLLRGIKSVTSNVTAIVTVADDGGSSGRIREDLGVVAPGDLRNCLVALADTEPLMEKLFQHRFGGHGSLAGHSFGNLFIAAMNQVVGSVEGALAASSKVLAVRGRVLPSTEAPVRLQAELADGTIVEGESNIPLAGQAIRRVRLVPADAAPVASSLQAIREADAILIGPGSLYTSVLPNLLIQEVAAELKASKAAKIYICNVMTQPGETDGYTASDHVEALLQHAGAGIVDYVLVNGQPVAKSLQSVYANQGAAPVEADVERIEKLGVKAFRADVISESDVVRHDPLKLCRTLVSMIYRLRPHAEHMALLDHYLIADTLRERKGGC